jgi:hypothetical protein
LVWLTATKTGKFQYNAGKSTRFQRKLGKSSNHLKSGWSKSMKIKVSNVSPEKIWPQMALHLKNSTVSPEKPVLRSKPDGHIDKNSDLFQRYAGNSGPHYRNFFRTYAGKVRSTRRDKIGYKENG